MGSALLVQPVDGVFFTGSHATGAKIAQTIGPRMIKLQLELGGKDPIYVCEDVDIATAAASLADGAMYNTGQSCCSVERIYVHASIHDAFVDAFVNEVRGFTVSDPTDEAAYIGPLTRAPQLDVLERQVADATAKGATLLLGGKRLAGPGNWFAPTVFSHVDHSMDLMREESFGPIIGIQKVADDGEAVRLMNHTEYGLTAGVYTTGRGAGPSHPGAGARRLGLLELLRSCQSAPAVERRRPLRHRADAVDLRHRDLHAAEGVAPQAGVKDVRDAARRTCILHGTAAHAAAQD